MMQQIATSKSNIAALGVPPEQDTQLPSSVVEDFRKLIKDQEKELGYGQPVEPIRSSVNKVPESKKETSDNSDIAAEQKADIKEPQSNVESQESKEAKSGPGAQSQESSNSPKQAENAIGDENTLDAEVTDTQDAPKVDWLGLLEKANENYRKLDNSEVSKEVDVTETQVSETSVASEVDPDAQQSDDPENQTFTQPLSNLLNTLLESDDTAEDMKLTIESLITKLESGEESLNLSELNEQELVALEQALEQWLSTEATSDQNIIEGLSEVDLDLLNALVTSPSKPEENNSQLNVFEQQSIDQTGYIDVQKDLAEKLKALPQVDNALKGVVELNDTKLDSLLNKLAEHLNLQKAESDKQNRLFATENIAQSAAKDADSGVKAEFIASLKVGLEEVKSQIKQGHQPALDLKALVNDTVNKMATAEQIQPVAEQKLDQALNTLNRTLDLAQMVNSASDPQPTQVTNYERIAGRESGQQVVVEQLKQQQNNNADRAINITRPEGHQQMADKVRWMVNSNNLQADIRLDPAELGSMQIRVNVSGDAASVSFVVQSQQARDVLEQATPRLKEMLEEQGIQLGQSSVEQESKRGEDDKDGEFAQGHHSSEEHEEGSKVTEQRIINGRLSGIDYYV